MATKRPLSPDTDNTGSQLPKCKFGLKCYRRNPNHFESLSHPHLESILSSPNQEEALAKLTRQGADKTVLQEQLTILGNLRTRFLAKKPSPGNKASPLLSKAPKDTLVSSDKTKDSPDQRGSPKTRPETSAATSNPDSAKALTTTPLYYLTRVKDVPSTHRGDGKSIYITQLLRASGGVPLKETLQINFMVDFEWLWMNYEVAKIQDLPLTILYGEDNPTLQSRDQVPSHVSAAKVKMPLAFGTHHTKMMVLKYVDNSVRIIISTANLVPSDWENRTQGLWVGPKCPHVTGINKNSGDSETGFKTMLLRYLNFYQMDLLKPFVSSIECCDFSDVKVFFVASVPGSHTSDFWGHRYVNSILRKHLNSSTVSTQWPLLIQCSSIGSLGPTPESWVESELGSSLGRGSRTVHLIYPSKANVLGSHDGILGGACLPYSRLTHVKQPWLSGHMHQWKSEIHQRTRAMPHIKTYAKISPDENSLAYVMLTSANLSKAAWGSLNKAGDKLLIKSYEAGVLFLPKFINGKDVFDLKGSDQTFYLPYDLPLTKFGPNDSPWLYDYLSVTFR